MIKSGLKIFALTLASLAFSLVCAELVLRILGNEPWEPSVTNGDGNRANIPLMTEKHPTLGWVNKPGKYSYPGFSPEVETISVTILEDSSRRVTDTPKINTNKDKKLLFVGGSYTAGYAISDNETFSWKLQSQLPQVNILNMGVPGYGTYQSLLALEEFLPKTDGNNIIFYAYIGHHQLRNILHPGWLDMFSKPEGESFLPPYASLSNNGNLIRHPSSSRNVWPLRDKLALVNKAEQTWLRLSSSTRTPQSLAVTEQLVTEMQSLTASHDAKFFLLLLQSNDPLSREFRKFLENSDINYVDCDPVEFSSDLRVKGEGHPNGKLNSFWAQCIAEYLNANDQLSDTSP